MSVRLEDARLDHEQEVVAAPFWRRLAADVVDCLLYLGIGVIIWKMGILTPSTLPEARFDWIDYAAELIANYRGAFYPFLAMSWCAGGAIVLVGRSLLGASLGERLLGLRLVDGRGEPARISRAFIHMLGTCLGLLFLFQGYAWAAVDKNRQGAANYLSGTLLIVDSPE